jgi:hypothetical protein
MVRPEVGAQKATSLVTSAGVVTSGDCRCAFSLLCPPTWVPPIGNGRLWASWAFFINGRHKIDRFFLSSSDSFHSGSAVAHRKIKRSQWTHTRNEVDDDETQNKTGGRWPIAIGPSRRSWDHGCFRGRVHIDHPKCRFNQFGLGHIGLGHIGDVRVHHPEHTGLLNRLDAADGEPYVPRHALEFVGIIPDS